MMNEGRLFWVTGLSGAGKTTISSELYEELRKKKENTVWLDGDQLREIFQNKDYSEAGRRELAYVYMRLCKALTDQGIDVIISVICMKDEYRDWNRKNIEKYYEIYLEVPIELLIKRDSKGLYARAIKGEIANVYGIDMPFEEPKNPDLKIVNDGGQTPKDICQYIIKQLNI